MRAYNKVLVYLGNNPLKEYDLFYDHDIINYNDEDCLNSIIISEKDIEIRRESPEFLLVINSKEEYAKYSLKELNYELDIKLDFIDYQINSNNIEITYQLETNENVIKLILKGE